MVLLMRYSRIGKVEEVGFPGIDVHYPKRRRGREGGLLAEAFKIPEKIIG
jgi:hypothetical protein